MERVSSKLPTISVVTPTYSGSLESLKKCLKGIRSQNYPQNKIEIVLAHGGLESDIKPIANKNKAKYIIVPDHLQNAEYNRGVAFNKATGDLALILDHDNFMPTKDFLREYVQPFIENKKVVAVESCYYHHSPKYPIMDRYFALIGALDPIPYYMGKTDRMNRTSNSWNLLGKAQDKGNYYLVNFERNPRKVPTIGTNGCIMRRKLVVKKAKTKPEYHYPIDVMVDVILSGHTTFAFTKNSLIHLTGSRGIISFLRRRLKFMIDYHFKDNEKRRYSVFMPGDLLNLIKTTVICITLIVPIYDSIRGYMKIKDKAWFIHPIMSFGMVIIYGWGSLVGTLVKKKNLL